MSAELLRISTPMVTSVAASQGTFDEDSESWLVGYAPELDEPSGRFLIASLHIHSVKGSVDVELAATVLGGPEGDLEEGEPHEEFAETLASSEALETLYAFARITARSLLGTIEIDADVQMASPAPEITRLVKTADT